MDQYSNQLIKRLSKKGIVLKAGLQIRIHHIRILSLSKNVGPFESESGSQASEYRI
jgi:hypothetical protein